MKSVLFVLGKHPSQPAAGDLMMTKLTMRLARESFRVSAVAMTPASVTEPVHGVSSVPKPELQLWRLFGQSLRTGKSLIHCRFDSPDLRQAIQSSPADRIVAEHSYMAEPCVSAMPDPAERLVVNTHVPESLVLSGTAGLWALPEARRVKHDEVRVARSARTVGAFDLAEAQMYSQAGARRAIYLDLTLPPRQQSDVGRSRQSLVFMGDMSWKPNKQALSLVLGSWTKIRQRVPNAELVLIGKGSEAYAAKALPGVRALGFVKDLDAELSTCRALIAPITVGGGVRVKILEAIALGLPVVGTRDAVGSLDTFLPLTVSPSDEHMVERSIELLLDRKKAATEGQALYEKNEQLWREQHPHNRIADWLS